MNRLDSASIVASCECGVKSPDVQYHKPGCKYRLIVERDTAREQLAAVTQELNDRLIERTEGFMRRLVELRTRYRELERELKVATTQRPGRFLLVRLGETSDDELFEGADADTVQKALDWMKTGFTSGFHPYWDIFTNASGPQA